MVRPMHRSRTMRRVPTRIPGGETKIHFKRRKPSPAICAQTGEPLHGVPRGTPSQMKALAKTKKRPSRPFGGFLSSRAMRALLKYEAREEQPSRE